jgi:hypothetical protein
MLRTDILKPSASLISSAFVDDMENGLATNIHDIDYDGVVEIDVVTERELESARGSTISLAVGTVLRKVL